jgi:uncharacterized protein
MRTLERIACVCLIGLGLAALGTDARAQSRVGDASASVSPMEAFRSGARALRDGDTTRGMTALEYAAEQGHTGAEWKLGRMYADGDQVPKDAVRAFQYFSRIANRHAEDNPDAPQSRFVANAFVALGHYYLEGIPNVLKADAGRAHEMFWYAASYFADPDAQYSLARLYLDGKGAPRDARQGLRWLSLAANKGQYHAQALLGHMLFTGEHVPRQAARGLMWLTLARDGAGNENWIVDLYDAAFKQATTDERSMALHYLERWLKSR